MKIYQYLLLLFLIAGCTTNEADEVLVIIGSDGRETPSCSYSQNAEISNYSFKPSAWKTPDYTDFGSIQRCTFTPYGYSEKFIAQYYEDIQFKHIYEQLIFDLSTSENTMQLFFKNNLIFSYAAFEGKLYLERINDHLMKFTWCEAKFLDSEGNTLVSSGSFYVAF